MTSPRRKKRFGQHHLTRSELCRPLVHFLRPDRRRVVEVGPGGGVLTRALATAGARVLALEIDPDWAFTGDLGARDAVDLVIADAAEFEWSRLPRGALVTGNLPFQISTSVIESLLPLGHVVPRAAFLVQREVGERLVAIPRSPAYGSLSVLVAAAAEARILGRVGRGSFAPPPKVDGVFIGLSFRSLAVALDEWELFCDTVRLAFALRRKTLRNALAAGWGRGAADTALQVVGGAATTRAEDLDVEDFLRLHAWRRDPH